MAYSIRLPDGTLVENIPDEVTPEAAKAKLLQQFPQFAPPDDTGDFMRGVKSYLPGLQETLGGAQTLLGATAKKALGEGAVSDYLLEHGRQNLGESELAQQKISKPTDSLTEAWEKGIGTVLTDWLPYQAGSGAANIAESLGFALAGGAAAGPLGAAEGLLGKTMVKKGIKEAAEQILKTEGKEAAQAYVEKQAKRVITSGELSDLAAAGAKAYGRNVGLGAQAAGHGLGEVGSRAAEQAREEGKRYEDVDLAKTLPAAAGHAVADYVANKIGLGALDGLAKPTQSMLMNVAKGMLVTGAKETPPELLQSMLERYGANLPLTDKEAIKEYINTAGAAFGMSVVPGGVGGVRSPVQQAKKPEGTPETPAGAPLQLGMNAPFTPVVFPDGSVATTPEEVKQHEEDMFTAKYAPEKVREPEQLNLPGMENLNPPAEEIPEPRIFKTAAEVEAARAKEEKAATREYDAERKAAEKAGQRPLYLRNLPEGAERTQPEPTISAEDIMMTAIPLRSAAKWVEKNVAGRTLSQVADMVKRDPSLIAGKDPRAQLLKTLLQKEVPAFEETPSVTPAEKPATKRINQPRASEPSVGVPVEPTGLATPAATTTAGESEAPVGRGLVSAGQPANARVEPKAGKPATLNATPVKPAVPTTVAKAPEAQAPSVATETVNEAEQRKKEAEQMRLAMEAQDKAYAKGPKPIGVQKVSEAPAPQQPATKTVAAAKRSEEEAQADKDWQGVMDRVLALKSPFDILGPRKSEAPANKEPRLGKTDQFGTQGNLFPLSKDNAKREAQRTPTAEQPVETKAEKDERQMELAPRKETPNVQEWAAKDDRPRRTAVYADDEVALLRMHSGWTGQYVYVGLDRKTGERTRADVDIYTGNLFTDEQMERLQKARRDVVFAESKKAAKNPDGPFTGAKGNVVGSENVDPRYVGYLQNLMQSMGLGDVRVFLVNPEDMQAPGAVDKYKLYKDYASVLTAGDSENEDGSVRVYGPDKRDFYISFRPGMSENKSVEVISHELGHAIEKIAFDNAAPETKAAIKKEFEAWLQSTKGKTGRELVQMLRNRETAETQMLTVDENKRAEDMRPYWTLFTEWFADNTSRWASTSEKPVSITEKFFSKVAQYMRDMVALITGRKYPPAASVAKFLDGMGPGSADMWMAKLGSPVTQAQQKAEFSVSYNTQQIVDSMGPLDAERKNGLTRLIEGVQDHEGIDLVTQFRTQVADSAAALESRVHKEFDGAVRNSLGKLNPMGLYRQAQDYSKMLLEYFQQGAIVKDPTTGLWKVSTKANVSAPADVYKLIDKYASDNGHTREYATKIASRVLEGHRLHNLLQADPDFPSHMSKSQVAALEADYQADPAFKAMNDKMDEARIDLIDHMIAVGRLSKEKGAEWKSVAGYVPFDRIEDFAQKFTQAKRTGRSPLAISKDPELVGSLKRPVGNVFDNYINTLGWMVGEVVKNDARVQTMRTLQDMDMAKDLRLSQQGRANTAGAYVGGEMNYWELPSKYDVLAFKDLNPPKAGWLRNLGAFSSVLRTSITALPPFALKQVSDDVQRAIFTSGVKDVGALVRMSLTNFPKLAYAELRGIQHPYVKEFGALGLTGEYDFIQNKPAASLLADLGYKPRGYVKEALHRLEGITRASDLAVRKAIYDQTLKESNEDALLAQTRAREFINFRRRGASDFVGAMVTTIPFFNSYVQGMDVIYRAASGKDSSASVGRAEARKLFMSRAAMAIALSSMYALGKGDDEEYAEMDLRTRDNNWILGNGVKIPVPGELGAIFKVIPERVVEYMRRQGTPEEQEAFEAVRTTLTYMYEQYVGRVVPVPQAIKPVIEAWANKSFLTGRELEGLHQKQMLPHMRRGENTSELAVAIANFSKDTLNAEVSPIMIDNALRGYFGSTAALGVMVTDSLLNPTRTDRPMHKWAFLSNYMYDTVGTRRMTEFYEEREKVGQLQQTMNELAKTDINAAVKFAEDHSNELMLNSAINSTLNQLEQTRAYRKLLNSKDGAELLPKEEREAQLEEIRKMEVELVRWLREVKVDIRKQPQ